MYVSTIDALIIPLPRNLSQFLNHSRWPYLPSTKFRMQKRKEKLTLLPQLRLSLLHRSDDHITNTSVWEPIQVGTETKGLNEEKRLGATVVRAVDYGAYGQTESHAEFCASGSSTWLDEECW